MLERTLHEGSVYFYSQVLWNLKRVGAHVGLSDSSPARLNAHFLRCELQRRLPFGPYVFLVYFGNAFLKLVHFGDHDSKAIATAEVDYSFVLEAQVHYGRRLELQIGNSEGTVAIVALHPQLAFVISQQQVGTAC